MVYISCALYLLPDPGFLVPLHHFQAVHKVFQLSNFHSLKEPVSQSLSLTRTHSKLASPPRPYVVQILALSKPGVV